MTITIVMHCKDILVDAFLVLRNLVGCCGYLMHYTKVKKPLCYIHNTITTVERCALHYPIYRLGCIEG